MLVHGDGDVAGQPFRPVPRHLGHLDDGGRTIGDPFAPGTRHLDPVPGTGGEMAPFDQPDRVKGPVPHPQPAVTGERKILDRVQDGLDDLVEQTAREGDKLGIVLETGHRSSWHEGSRSRSRREPHVTPPERPH
ncbi:hypothetical protein ACFY4C_13015 [Actinomadura viridis]|uniref:hypothetical protein n=1 Tax=Actinomadura viridis TaxID=58110 RepID=UPI00368BF190